MTGTDLSERTGSGERTGLGLARTTQTKLMWAAIPLFIIAACVTQIPGLIPPGLASVLFTVLLFGVAVLHGTLYYRGRDFLVFFVLTFLVSNIVENIGVATGWPFGPYFYSANLGPKLFLVPLIIAPAYFAVGYVSWTLARVFLRIRAYRLQGLQLFLVPLISAFVMASWDFAQDPVNATINHNWIWTSAGPYWGVPFINFVPGWFLTVYIFFQLFALYLHRFVKPDVAPRLPVSNGFWYAAVVTYAGIALQRLTLLFVGNNVPVTDRAGKTWMTGDIYQSMGLATFFTLVFFAVLAAAILASDSPSGAEVAPAPARGQLLPEQRSGSPSTPPPTVATPPEPAEAPTGTTPPPP